MIKLELTEDDALLFRAFKEHQDLFSILYTGEVFETKNGVAILNFNKDGVLTEVRKDILTYKRGVV